MRPEIFVTGQTTEESSAVKSFMTPIDALNSFENGWPADWQEKVVITQHKHVLGKFKEITKELRGLSEVRSYLKSLAFY